ncbi:CvpA family protein [Seongchinamella unica]|uniref:CvpA family protein n=1 Tax=Seongchinamella unica TaxID=2547392 RepID=A0A4R5LS39_9GAMM|nr:CvpA family protein [Seongchinamella unica]TDG13709.1 CvpA family protein [Seongchinamella unica]
MIDLSQLTAADWVIIVILSVSTLLSLWRGFVREALSLLGWVAAFIVAHLFVDQLALQLSSLIANITGRYVAAYAILFVSTLVVFTLVVKVATSLVRAAGLSFLDRVLGTIFGFARGVILILVAAYVIKQLIPEQNQQWLHQSVLMPHLNMLADWVQAVFSNTVPGERITT